MDPDYAEHAADRVLTLEPATGAFATPRKRTLRFWS
jgi:hypothetical protein